RGRLTRLRSSEAPGARQHLRLPGAPRALPTARAAPHSRRRHRGACVAMFKNVLVGVDGRPNGRDAIALASRLLDPTGKLTLAHVHSGQVHPLHAITPGLVAEEREASQKLLAAELAAADVDAELVAVEDATPGAGLHRRAEEQGADLIVVGSCSRGPVGRVMLGDDTRAALNGAPCAVAIAARGYSEHPIPLAKVGVAYNGSTESKDALALAREIAAPR